MSKLFFLCFMILSAVICTAQQEKKQLFEEAGITIDVARKQAADILCPYEFSNALEHYQNAVNLNEEGKSLKEIKVELETSIYYLTKMNENIDKNLDVFKPIINLRKSALASNANIYASTFWELAENSFKDAVDKFNDGNFDNITDIEEDIQTIEKYYSEAKKYGDKANYLIYKWEPLINANNTLANLISPENYSEGIEKFYSILNSLSNGENINDINNLINDAGNSFKIATENSKRFLKKYPNLLKIRHSAQIEGAEDYAVKLWADAEVSLTKAGSAFENNDFDDAKSLVEIASKKYLSVKNFAIKNRPASYVKYHLSASEKKKKATSIVKTPEIKKSMHVTHGDINNIFTPGEAEITCSGNQINILLIGLKFPPIGAILSRKDKLLVDKIIAAIKLYPNSDVEINGYTDNVCVKSLNRDVSQKRVDNIKSYILNNSNIDQSRLIATGYGETAPIADNTTHEGRMKNKRIEVIIKNIGE